MKAYLNDEMAAVAKSLLTRDDIKNISEKHDLKQSAVTLIISGKRKTTKKVIDTIQMYCKVRHRIQATILKHEQ